MSCRRRGADVLRKMRIDGPPERLEELLEAARWANLEIDDWAIDTTTAYGWPGRADGNAYVLIVAEDTRNSIGDVVAAMRGAYASRAGRPSAWIVEAGSFVFLPDGMEPEWYPPVVALAEQLHRAEQDGDEWAIVALRKEITAQVDAALPAAERALARLEQIAADRLPVPASETRAHARTGDEGTQAPRP